MIIKHRHDTHTIVTRVFYSTVGLLRRGIGNVIKNYFEYNKNAFQRLKTILVTSHGLRSFEI